MGLSPNPREHNIVPILEGKQGEGEDINEINICYHPHLLSAQGAWDSAVRAWSGPGEAGYRQ